MSMSWADVCCSSTSQPFKTPTPHFDGKNELQRARALWNSRQADLLFQDIVGHQSTDPEYDIYLQLACAQIALDESRSEALATVFDAMSSTANRLSPHYTTHLVEPTSDVLNMFAPTDLCNYSDPKVSHKPKTPNTTKPKYYGVDEYALSLARDYMSMHGYHARTITRRVILERHIADWTRSIVTNSNPLPHTRKIIFAIAHGLKLVHVRRGSTLEWNKFRDNFGNKIN